MKNWLIYPAEWALMVLISAFLFVEFFQLNDLLFSRLEHASGINWIFLPAGFRVLMVLVLGLPGALGIVLGTLWLDRHTLEIAGWTSVLLTAAASGMGPWLVKRWMESRRWLDSQLNHITAQRLLNFVLVYAVVNAIAHQFIRWHFQHVNSKPWLDVWPMFVGDALGALVILYCGKYTLIWLRSRVQRQA